jgi:hypothetical protein
MSLALPLRLAQALLLCIGALRRMERHQQVREIAAAAPWHARMNSSMPPPGKVIACKSMADTPKHLPQMIEASTKKRQPKLPFL